jgi:hypothetical protein
LGRRWMNACESDSSSSSAAFERCETHHPQLQQQRVPIHKPINCQLQKPNSQLTCSQPPRRSGTTTRPVPQSSRDGLQARWRSARRRRAPSMVSGWRS